MGEVLVLRLDYLDGSALKRAIAGGTQLLEENKSVVDSLNVFPVPDGDTGTNMFLTLSAALREVEKLKDAPIAEVAEAAAMGSLMGARGNSGVIFSQLFRGFARGLENKAMLDGPGLAYALQEAVNVAYKAVMKAVEGTMLTVAREAARAAVAAARNHKNVLDVLAAALQAAEETLERTPEMLPALKEAGVVDAGGKGLVFFMRGALAALRGEQVKRRKEPMLVPVAQSEGVKEPGAGTRSEALRYKYCTEFLLKGSGLPLDKMREELASYGDCLLVVGTPDVAKVHIHTNNPGFILEYCVVLGDLSEIQINNMALQHEEFVAQNQAQAQGQAGDRNGSDGGRKEPTVQKGKEVGVVAVATGEGLEEILHSLGADVIVQGGQTMNPSIEDIVKAAESLDTPKIIILPNNSNVILTAEQARKLLDREVAVIPTSSVPQGLAALIAMKPGSDFDLNVRLMNEAKDRVRTGEVTYAVRNSKYNGVEIGEKDFIGIVDGELKVAGKGREETASNLIAEMVSETTELITIYYGEGVPLSEARVLADRVQEQYPYAEVELQYGGQPIYYYIISVE
ncbi:MAG TPA: DAK2 domain-containing protein [Firmicutes bacterium]|nr:DAK2 domain-containing protein [Bacillota bacterium]